MHSHSIDKKAGIVFVTLVGEVSVEEIQETVSEITSDTDFCSSMHLLTDLREFRFPSDPSELKRLIDTFRENFGESAGKEALIVESRRETAMAMLHKKNVAEFRNVEVFSTIEAALEWLNLG